MYPYAGRWFTRWQVQRGWSKHSLIHRRWQHAKISINLFHVGCHGGVVNKLTVRLIFGAQKPQTYYWQTRVEPLSRIYFRFGSVIVTPFVFPHNNGVKKLVLVGGAICKKFLGATQLKQMLNSSMVSDLTLRCNIFKLRKSCFTYRI